MASEQAENYKKRGDVFYEQKQYDKAIDEFTKAIKIDPDYLAAYYNRGLANLDMNLYYKAIVDFDMVIMMKPDDKDSYFNRGLAYSRVNKLKLAMGDLKKAAELGDQDAKAMIESGDITSQIERSRSRQMRISAILEGSNKDYNRVVTVVNTDNEFNGNTICTTHSKGDPLFDGREGIVKSMDYYNASDVLIKSEQFHTAAYNALYNKTKTIIWYNPDSTIMKKESILTGSRLTCKKVQYFDEKGNPLRIVLLDRFGKEIGN
jgi:tetratricopeptide (TPR) repeat protein